MLRSIHDPERGAGFVEYGAVILLVAAIAAVVMTAGIPGRITGIIDKAVDSIGADSGTTGPQADGDAPSGRPSDGPGSGTPDGRPPGEPGDRDPGAVAPNAAPGTGTPEATPALADPPRTDITPVGLTSVLPFGSPPGVTSPPGVADLFDAMREYERRVAGTLWQRGADTVDDTIRLFTNPPGALADTWNGVFSDIEQSVRQSVADHGDEWANGNRWLAGAKVLGDAALYAYLDSPLSESAIALFANEDRREQYANGEWVEALTESLLDLGEATLPGPKFPGSRGTPDTPNVTTDPDTPALADGQPQRPGTDGDRDQDPDGDRDGQSCTRPSSFVPGTPVLLADGTTMPIEDIAIGDEVLAFDPLTGEEGAREVTDLISTTGTKTLVTLTFDDGQGAADTLAATDEHPFWVPDRAQWVDAVDLEPGTWLRTSTGTWVKVTVVDARTADSQRVHNLTIADLHTYYVAAGATPILVHNAECFDPSDAGSSLPEYVPGGPTSGNAVDANGNPYAVVSGNKREDADLINIVNEELRQQGILPGSANSARASDAEQKFAAIMIRDDIDQADIVINNPSGPCTQRLGCNDVLNSLLGDKELTVHWPDGRGGYTSRRYGGGS